MLRSRGELRLQSSTFTSWIFSFQATSLGVAGKRKIPPTRQTTSFIELSIEAIYHRLYFSNKCPCWGGVSLYFQSSFCLESILSILLDSPTLLGRYPIAVHLYSDGNDVCFQVWRQVGRHRSGDVQRTPEQFIVSAAQVIYVGDIVVAKSTKGLEFEVRGLPMGSDRPGRTLSGVALGLIRQRLSEPCWLIFSAQMVAKAVKEQPYCSSQPCCVDQESRLRFSALHNVLADTFPYCFCFMPTNRILASAEHDVPSIASALMYDK